MKVEERVLRVYIQLPCAHTSHVVRSVRKQKRKKLLQERVGFFFKTQTELGIDQWVALLPLVLLRSLETKMEKEDEVSWENSMLLLCGSPLTSSFLFQELQLSPLSSFLLDLSRPCTVSTRIPRQRKREIDQVSPEFLHG